jgi:hypothetical protein
MDPNCNWFEGTKCLKCSVGFRFSAQGHCVELDYLCRSYDSVTFDCLECYAGYMASDEGKCGPITEPGCLTWTNRSCNSCQPGYYILQGHCQAVDPLCSQFDLASKTCQACYAGY